MRWRVVDRQGQVREFRSWTGAARAAVELGAAGRKRRQLVGYDDETGKPTYAYRVQPGEWDGVVCLFAAPGCRFELAGTSLQVGRNS